LASGEWSLPDVGDPLDPAGLAGGEVVMACAEPAGELLCEVLWIDAFGNAQLNTDGSGLGEMVQVEIGPRVVEARRAAAFGDLRAGEPGLVTDSYGLLALALNGAPAAAQLGVGEGDVVRLSTGRRAEGRR